MYLSYWILKASLEKRQRETPKIPLFTFMFSKEIIVEKPNLNHHNNSVLVLAQKWLFFVHIILPSVDTAFCSGAFGLSCYLWHLDHIACWEITRIFDSTRSLQQFFHIYTKFTATPTYRQKFVLVGIFSARKFQIMRRWVKKFINSRVSTVPKCLPDQILTSSSNKPNLTTKRITFLVSLRK